MTRTPSDAVCCPLRADSSPVGQHTRAARIAQHGAAVGRRWADPGPPLPAAGPARGKPGARAARAGAAAGQALARGCTPSGARSGPLTGASSPGGQHTRAARIAQHEPHARQHEADLGRRLLEPAAGVLLEGVSVEKMHSGRKLARCLLLRSSLTKILDHSMSQNLEGFRQRPAAIWGAL